jgi:heat shock protein HtpX
MQFVKRIFLFALVNILVMTTFTIVLGILGALGFRIMPGGIAALAVWSLIWGMGGAFISLLLSRQMAKWMMGVKVIDPAQAVGQAGDLVRMVRNLSERAGLTCVPEVGIYESEEVNAFATGPSKNRALVAVSSGLLRRLPPDQLEAVLGHEITHISNGDMVTMTLIQGIVNAFVIFFSRIVAFFIGQQVDSRNRWIVEFVSIIVLQIVFGLLGSIVVNYFSRAREFRADAGSAHIAGASKMIAALRTLAQTHELIDASPDQKSVATLKITDRNGFSRLFSTHPPLEERIAQLQALA